MHLNRGIAFVDHVDEAIVQCDVDANLNFDCISPTNGTRPWVTDKISLGTHWRLKEAER
jgi:hypothetical protein